MVAAELCQIGAAPDPCQACTMHSIIPVTSVPPFSLLHSLLWLLLWLLGSKIPARSVWLFKP